MLHGRNASGLLDYLGLSTGTGFTLSGDGAKSVTARQTDVAGNTGASSSALAFTLDTTAAAPTLALATNSGSASVRGSGAAFSRYSTSRCGPS